MAAAKAGSPARPRIGNRTRLLVASACLLALLTLAEIAARLFSLGPPVYPPRVFDPPGGVPFEYLDRRDSEPFFAYRRRATFASVYDPTGDVRGYFGPTGRVTYEINDDRMRGPLVSHTKPPGVFRVLCLGDSITIGEGVRYEDTYPVRLQQLLAPSRRGQRIEVLNAGVQAYGTRNEFRFFREYGRTFHPDVVILGFFLNDALPTAETVRQNDAFAVLGNRSWPARVSRLWDLVERSRRSTRLQDDYFRSIRNSFVSPEWDACREALRHLRQMSAEDGFRFVVVVFPVLWQLDGDYPFADIHARVIDACRDSGCESLDLLDAFRDHRADALWVHPTDQHPNEIAHEMAARRIAEYLSR